MKHDDERRVTFRLVPGVPAAFADLRGEMRDFTSPIALEARGDAFEATVPLRAGVYQYKFLLEGERYVVDPANPRTRGEDGIANSVLCVSGTDEPVLHAPAPPFVYGDEDGRLVIRAALRKGHGERLVLRYDEGHGERAIEMRPEIEEDQHVLFTVTVPSTARQLDYLFELESGAYVGLAGGAGQRIRIAPRDFAPRETFMRDAIVYTIFVDRFRRAGGKWPSADGASDARRGGDLRGVVEALPHLVSLGVNVLHLTPFSVASSSHRYDAVDARAVDPALGGEEALRALLDAAHALGMRVIADFAVTHVHMEFFAFEDVRRRGPASPYFSWFSVYRFPFHRGVDPGYEHYQKGRWEEPLLRLENPDVAAYVAGTFEHWARFGFDGFRVDAAAEVPRALLGAIRKAVRAVSPDAIVFGEVIPPHLADFLRAGLDAATDFTSQRALHALVRDGDAARAKTLYARAHRDRGAPAHASLSFASTHDQDRLLTIVKDARKARLALFVLFTRPETPTLVYGDEIGLHAESPSLEFEGAWPDRQCFPWDDEESWDHETLELVRTLARSRRESLPLRHGEHTWLESSGAVLAFRRTRGEDVVDVVVNASDAEVRVPLSCGAPSGARIALSVGAARLDDDLLLGPFSAAALERIGSEEATQALEIVRSESRLLALDAFRNGRTELLALPIHLYVTVTEACNLRCLHCITHAPRRTRDGSAREIAPWVLEALAEPFAAAEYIGFAHGGESLVSPMFFPTLRAVQRARAGKKTNVHLLSNGMRLDRATTERLVAAGVTSIAVSLDGTKHETNDALRLGARFETIVRNVKDATKVRDEQAADLRVGISFVVGRSNLADLDELPELAERTGVDWVKVEEMFPTTLVAAKELVRPNERAWQEARARLGERMSAKNVVLVDHFDPPAGCACEARTIPALAAFRAADDFANRAAFAPCRMAFEQACVDPDGTVHAVDYFSPPLGSLSTRTMLELWNGEVAQQARREALAKIPVSRRVSCFGLE